MCVSVSEPLCSTSVSSGPSAALSCGQTGPGGRGLCGTKPVWKGDPLPAPCAPSLPSPPSDQSSQAADSSRSAARRPGSLQGRGAGVHEKLAARTLPQGGGVSEAAGWQPREARPMPGADHRPPIYTPHCAGVGGIRKGCWLTDPRPPPGSASGPLHTPLGEGQSLALWGEGHTGWRGSRA